MTLYFFQGSRDIVFDQFSQMCLKGIFTSAASSHRCWGIAPELLETLLWLSYTFPGSSPSMPLTNRYPFFPRASLTSSPIHQVPSTETPSLPAIFLLLEILLIVQVLRGLPSMSRKVLPVQAPPSGQLGCVSTSITAFSTPEPSAEAQWTPQGSSLHCCLIQ